MASGMITSRQIDLVQDSFAAVLPRTDAVAADFYRRLFEFAPETRALFRHDMDEQGRKLFLTLATVVDALDRRDEVIPVAQALAVRHVRYGVRDAHYAAVGAALVEALRHALGERFDADTERAWTEGYAILSDCMLAASGTKMAA
jgi:hemoglobin-like flavoprotein